MYNQGMSELKDENFDAAITSFETLQSRYPYGRYAQQALLELAYTYYRKGESESSVSSADLFIKQYPNHQYVDYAYYVKGLANFHGEISILQSLGGQDPTERDPKAAQDSFNAFKDLITRFPNSKYAQDSKIRMQYLLNLLAKHELHVADYYLRRGAPVAAVNRAQGILTQYPGSPATLDALKILVEAYDKMGMNELRDDAQRVLSKNSRGLSTGNAINADLGKSEKSWWKFWK